MTATCNVSSVGVGTKIRLSISGRNGTAPYRGVISDGTTNLLNQTGLIENQVVFVDIQLNIVGTYSFNAYVIDSCSTGIKSVVEVCNNITVTSCAIPGCDFTIIQI